MAGRPLTLSINYAKAFSVKTIPFALFLALLTMTTGSLSSPYLRYGPMTVDRVTDLMSQLANNPAYATLPGDNMVTRRKYDEGIRDHGRPTDLAHFGQPCLGQLTASSNQ